MAIHNPIIPFYLMEKSKEFHPGIPPKDLQGPKGQIAGFEKAIAATKKRIVEFKSGGADVSDLEFHLRNLEQRLEVAQNKAK